MKVGDSAALATYVAKRAPQYQLDPFAVLAVALQEGISGKVGDNGTSFGPWQLHQGGAYPASAPQTPDAANAWAWSPAGVDYVLGRMQSVAGGLRGKQAVRAIVYRFERPLDPATEYANAVKALPYSDGGPSGGGGGVTSIVSTVGNVTGVTGTVNAVTGVVSDVTGAANAVSNVGTFLGKLADPSFWVRALEVAGGALLVFFGLYLLGRESGVVDKATGAAATVAEAIPETRLAGAAVKARTARRQQVRASRQRQQELDAKYGAEAPF